MTPSGVEPATFRFVAQHLNHCTTTVPDLFRGINNLKNGYQPKTNKVKDENGDLVADSHSILDRRRHHNSQLFNVHGVSDVRQTEIYTAEPLVPDPSTLEVEMAIEKLKRHKSPGIDQIPVELITIHCDIHKLINYVWNKEEMTEWKE
jgi:hypothetical protein